jgi:hypothetical protein
VLELHAIAAKKEEEGAEFAVAMTMEERQRFLTGIQAENRAYLKMLGTVNAERSECSRPTDRESIHAAIRDSIGFAKLNRMLFGVMEEWMEVQLLAELAASRKKRDAHKVMSWLFTLGCVYGEQGRHRDAQKVEEELCRFYQLAAASSPESTKELIGVLVVAVHKQFKHFDICWRVKFVTVLFQEY